MVAALDFTPSKFVPLESETCILASKMVSYLMNRLPNPRIRFNLKSKFNKISSLFQDLHALDITSETMTLTERGEPQYNLQH